MTHEDFLLLADKVVAGPLDERTSAYEGRLPHGVATKVESALRQHAVAALFKQVVILPGDSEETVKQKAEDVRAANAATLQSILST